MIKKPDEIISDSEYVFEKGAQVGNFIFKPLYFSIPKFIRSKFEKLSPYYFCLALISRLTGGIFLGCTFPKFFKKHRFKLLFITIITCIPVIYEVLYKK
ncbi:MAG: hypothetical protein ACQESP_07440 [Candidatus Muiribacteriota bacterium]